MEQGFIRVAAATPQIRVAYPEYNAGQIVKLMEDVSKNHAKFMVFT